MRLDAIAIRIYGEQSLANCATPGRYNSILQVSAQVKEQVVDVLLATLPRACVVPRNTL